MSDTPLYEVRMVRPDLRGVPRYPVPAPFSLRPYQPGDAATSVAIHRLAERYHQDLSEGLFHREFGWDDAPLIARQLFLCDGDGQPVGTATAWQGDGGLGRINWVAVVPEAQGRGLGKALVSALCDRFSALGHAGVYLTTETVRLPAIRLYLHFGFTPEVRGAADREAWAGVAAQGLALPTGTEPIS